VNRFESITEKFVSRLLLKKRTVLKDKSKLTETKLTFILNFFFLKNVIRGIPHLSQQKAGSSE